MASRPAFPGTATNTTHLASEDNSLPGGWIGYVENTALNQGSIGSTITDVTSLSVTVTVNTSRKIKISGHVVMANDTAATQAWLSIREATTVLNQFRGPTPTATRAESFTVEWIGNPSSGSHTYKLSVQTAGTGTITAVGDVGPPARIAYILVEDVGPSS